VIVGVNKYRLAEEAPVNVLKIDNSAVRTQQLAKLARIRETRDSTTATKALEHVTECARTDGNLLEAAIAAARARCTVGEISDAMESVFGR